MLVGWRLRGMAEGVGLSLPKGRALEIAFGHKIVRFTDCQSN